MYSYVGLIHPKHIETFTGSPSKIIHKWYMMVYFWLLDIYLQKHPKQISVIHVNICHTLTLHGGNDTTIPSTLNHIHWLNPNQNVDPNTFFSPLRITKASRKSVASEDLRKVGVHHLEGGHNILSFVESRGVEALSRPMATFFQRGLVGDHLEINYICSFLSWLVSYIQTRFVCQNKMEYERCWLVVCSQWP